MDNKIKIGISVGDINGIGLEVILKTLIDERITDLCTPIIYGSSKVVSYHKNIVDLDVFSYQGIKTADQANPKAINVLNCWKENVNIHIGQANQDGGKYALLSLEKSVEDLQNNSIDALVTAPINKNAMQMAGFEHVGHTEYLTKAFNVKESLMLMVNDGLRIGLVTNHIPIQRVALKANQRLILKKIQIMDETLRRDFGIDRPKIAVLGLNPHASDQGLIGDEEMKSIMPAIQEAKDKFNIMAIGPYSADGFFGSGQYRHFDGILAMFHDQGLVPFKLLSFGEGVNYTAGLPVIRTSPDHGTAFDIAGQNKADPSSFRKALFLALDVAKNRANYEEMNANPLRGKKVKQVDEDVSKLPEAPTGPIV